MSELDLLKSELFGDSDSSISDIKLWPGSRETSIEDAARGILMAVKDMKEGNTTPISLDF